MRPTLLAIPGGRNMTDDEALRHRTRKLVFNYVSAHPGSSFATIREVFDLTKGTLDYHLHYFERHGLLRSASQGRQKLYYPIKAAPVSELQIRMPDFDPASLTEVQQRIYTIIRQKPGLSISELETVTGMNRRVLQYNIKVLRERMVVVKQGNGRSTRYESTTREKLHEELNRFVIMKFLKGEIDEKTYLRMKGEIERERLKE